MPPRKVAVLGADGFIGRHVVASLCRCGRYDVVRCVDRVVGADSHARWLAQAPRLEFIVADITVLEQARAVLSGCEAVVHAATLVDLRGGCLHDGRVHDVNVGGTRNVVTACLETPSVRRLIHFSSASAAAEVDLGEGERQVGSGTSSSFGASMRLAEGIVADAGNYRERLSTLCLRSHVVIGPGDVHTESMLSGVAPPSVGTGEQRCAPIYVKNLADLAAHACAAVAEPSVGVLEVGDAHVRSAELRRLLLSCRPPQPATDAPPSSAASIRRRLHAALMPAYISLWLAWALVAVAKVVDVLTLGRTNWRWLQRTGAALRHEVAGSPRHGESHGLERGYAAARGFVPRYPWPDGVRRDLSRYALGMAAKSVASTRREPAARVTHRLSYEREDEPRRSAPGRDVGCDTARRQATRGADSAARHIFERWTLRGLTLRNRVIKEATFEAGCTADGVPTEHLVRFHEAVAAGGAALTTVAYAAVSADGRSFATQLLLSDAARPMLRELTAAVHRHGGAAMVQLTHAGGFADRDVIGRRQIGPSVVFNPAGIDWPRQMGQADIQRVTADFASGARLAVACGFDAVEVHCGHGYLLAQFLSPYTNRRTDCYGWRALADRLRFPLAVCAAVREAVGDAVPVVVKFNLDDGFEGGIALEDAIAFAQALEAAGTVDLLIPSGGWISRNGFYMLRGAVPLSQMVKAQRKSLVKRLALAALGPWLVPTLEWRPAFFGRKGRSLLPHLRSLPVCLLGGVDSLAVMEEAMRDGFSCVAVARALLREPDFLHRLQGEDEAERTRPSRCSHCNECIVESAMAELPLRCVERG